MKSRGRRIIAWAIWAGTLVLACSPSPGQPLSDAPVSPKEANPFYGAFFPGSVKADPGESIDAILKIGTNQTFDKVKLALHCDPGIEIVSGPTKEILMGFKMGDKRSYRYRFKIKDREPKTIRARLDVLGLSQFEAFGATILMEVNPKAAGNVSVKTLPDGAGIRVHTVGGISQ